MERKTETKAVKKALLAAGIKARVKHGQGSASGWLYIYIDPALKMREKAIVIAQFATGRRGEYDGCINVFQA